MRMTSILLSLGLIGHALYPRKVPDNVCQRCRWITTARFANPVELDEIEAAFAQFDSRDERSLPPKSFCQFALVQPCGLAQFDQPGAKCVIVGRKN